jgi:Zn-dependent alcohol dehydrogenase
MPRAAVCHDFGAPLSVEEIELDPPGPREVRVRLEAVGICHSDVALAAGAWGGELPAVFGHEACGTVVEAGAGAEVPEGERVVVGLIRSCGSCVRCTAGELTFCSTTFRLDECSPIGLGDGRRAAQGLRCAAFADEVLVHASQLVPVPADVPAASACLIGCSVLTGTGAVLRTAEVAPGASVVVIGAGGVGLNAVQGARLAGAALVAAVDVVPWKLELARAMGADELILAPEQDVPAAVARVTDGAGADVVVTTVGAADVVEQGLACLRRGGSLVVAGMPPSGGRASFDPTQLAHDGTRILGSKLGSARPREDVPRMVGLYREGALKLDELVSGRFPLEGINDAVAGMHRGEAIRNVIVF